MKKWIRRWLGLTDIDDELAAIRLLMATKVETNRIEEQVFMLRNDLSVTFSTNEADDAANPNSKRRQLSDELAERVKKKLLAEENARRMTVGHPLLNKLP